MEKLKIPIVLLLLFVLSNSSTAQQTTGINSFYSFNTTLTKEKQIASLDLSSLR